MSERRRYYPEHDGERGMWRDERERERELWARAEERVGKGNHARRAVVVAVAAAAEGGRERFSLESE